jgi:phosphate transport system permease protein
MNRTLKWLCMAIAALIFVAMVGLAFQIINDSSKAFSKLGFGLLTRSTWDPQREQFGALSLIYGTLVTSVVSVFFATLLGVAIGLFLSMLAPRRVARVIGPLVEMLAAVPSVVVGLIGIIVIAPFLAKTIEPALHDVFGFIPLFGPPQSSGNSIFTASVVLTFMVLPEIAALTRDVFATVPRSLTDGAAALGATTWETIRGVVLPTTSSGVVSACMLAFGRAMGEAIAVTQVVGGQTALYTNLFKPGDTLASRIAEEFASPVNMLHTSVLYYVAALLMVFGVVSSLAARAIAHGTRIRN